MSLRFFFPPAWFMLFSHPGMSSSSKVHLSFQVQPPGWVWSVCFSPFSEIPVSLKTTFLRSILIFCVHLVHCFKVLFILPWCASNISPVYSPDNGHKQYCIHLWICVRWISLHQSEGFQKQNLWPQRVKILSSSPDTWKPSSHQGDQVTFQGCRKVCSAWRVSVTSV